MALTSPRFTSSNTLRNVAAGGGLLRKGARGRAVHLMQLALMDGSGRASLPNSPQNPTYSPDAIFGEHTRQAVKQVPRERRSLVHDGLRGQKGAREGQNGRA